jgi:long-chain-fatty-acid--[acyl-carrier-protein] ligase
VQLIEGYGITECSPVVCANRLGQLRAGVGFPLPDVELLIVDHETYEPLADGDRGLILIAGPNVFSGYLAGKPDPFISIAGRSWYNSGDLGFLKNGALYISGRLKRFVKIAGEMISLPAIEQCLKEIWQDSDDGPALAVVAQEFEEGKRVELVLFSRCDISVAEANKQLRVGGFANIVKIATSKKIKSLPILGSGKADIQSLQAMLAK